MRGRPGSVSRPPLVLLNCRRASKTNVVHSHEDGVFVDDAGGLLEGKSVGSVEEVLVQ